MFISTFGFTEVFHEGQSHKLFAQKAIDVERGVELFEIGSAFSVDTPVLGPFYCLKKDAEYIPFSVHLMDEISVVPMSEFNLTKWRGNNPSISFPVVHVTISNLGRDPRSIDLLRGSISCRDVWGDERVHGFEFPASTDKSSAFKDIQEALPVLLFEDYAIPCQPRPVICRHVSPVAYEPVAFDASGTLEAASVVLKAPLADPEGPMSVLDRMEEHSRQAPLRVEEIMAEILNLDRGHLFFGHSFTSPLMSSDRLLAILRQSFSAYYSGHFSCFERFFILIMGTQANRQTARAVFEHCVPRPWPDEKTMASLMAARARCD